MKLQNKIAIITGAAQGIGKATAEKFISEGATVVLADIDTLKGEIVSQSLGDKALFQRTDVGSFQDLQSLVKFTLAAFGRIDIVVNNAAVNIPGDVVEISDEDWDKSFNINVTSMKNMCKLVIPHMKEQGHGSIVNLASANSFIAEPELVAYVATKGAILMLTKAIALDCAPHNIRVNAICPGWVETTFNDKHADRFGGTEHILKSISDIHPTGKTIQPEEIANVVSFVASDEASALVGVGLLADAGLTIK